MARKSKYASAVVEEIPELDFVPTSFYGRLSVEDGDDIQNNSIGNQMKLAEDFVFQHPELKIVEWYSDNGFTGMNYDRPDFRRMMADIRAGKSHCILVKDISRFGRHFLMTSEYVERALPAMGIRLICINDGYDSADENADAPALLMPFKMIMNDNYVKDISRKIRSGITAKMNSGEYLPSVSSIPYGYLRNPKENTYDIDPEAAGTVRRIFELRAAGQSYTNIVRELNRDGILCPGRLRYERGITMAAKYKDATWIRGTIRKIVSDPVYTGKRIYGRVKRDKLGREKKRRPQDEWQIVENAHPPIITTELFEQVQKFNKAELERRGKFEKASPLELDYRRLLQGKIVCGDCGSAMTAGKGSGRPGKGRLHWVYYECNDFRESGRDRCCSHYIRQEAIMERLTNMLNQQVAIAVDLEKMIADIQRMPRTQQHQRTAQETLHAVRLKLGNLEAKMEQLLIDLTSGVIDRDEYDYAKASYTRQREQLRMEESRAEQDAAALQNSISSTRQWIEKVRQYQRLPEINREIIELLVKEIRVFRDRSISITLNYADPYAPLRGYLEEIEEVKEHVG
ncbi:hypothetical protein D3Z52_00370 [Clostridiaceae bacterium]|jgi:DNA invertase Pin-like site-specific DNA recombinase/predicted  nucleic acid-binding Zn-ribbon protein|nr:hypothetical protein [Clostridiaceae bacterium]NBI81199.1 hypothetical protein [Clostridiaceae bacterium]RKJ83033.1 hypothetical protein D7X33_00835 [Butyricicoccus sp. 1XD8-22]